ncbi:tetratricopeptide repeat protein [Zavarzinia sp. CC-PAN008]|uniref:tetratricopeptide repeat protein n=1 Tax=Zavarzinia sp. CC-PAN008 TaxID=3243332 RepID=UPI003F748C3D
MRRWLWGMILGLGILQTQAPAYACGEADDLYKRGLYPEYIEQLKQLSENGFVECTFTLGTVYRDGILVPQDYEQALAWYSYAAEQGHAFAQFDLGTMFDNGNGVKQDYLEAARWYQRSADQGFNMAQYNLGVLYAEGLGVPKDERKAQILFALSTRPSEKPL